MCSKALTVVVQRRITALKVQQLGSLNCGTKGNTTLVGIRTFWHDFMCPNFVLPLIAWYKDSRMFCDAPDWLDRTPACFVTPQIGWTESQLVLWRPWLVGQNPSLFCDAPDWLIKTPLVLRGPWLVGQTPSLFCDAPDWLDRTPACFVTPQIGWTESQLVLWRPWLVGQNPSLFFNAPDWLPSLFCDAPDWLDKKPGLFPLIYDSGSNI